MFTETRTMRSFTIVFATTVFLLILLGVAVAIDRAVNGGRLWRVATGQAGVEEACLPALSKALVDRGFSPSNIEFGQPPSLGFAFGPKNSFVSDFTFADGVEETRVDGIMDCEIGRAEAHVVVRTNARPIRAT